MMTYIFVKLPQRLRARSDKAFPASRRTKSVEIGISEVIEKFDNTGEVC
jgi:hypothetical protein